MKPNEFSKQNAGLESVTMDAQGTHLSRTALKAICTVLVLFALWCVFLPNLFYIYTTSYVDEVVLACVFAAGVALFYGLGAVCSHFGTPMLSNRAANHVSWALLVATFCASWYLS